MDPRPSAVREVVLGAGRVGLVLAFAVLRPTCATAQFMHDPFPGAKPTKLATGPGLTWNGTAWQAQPGVEIVWDITVVNDAIDPAVIVKIDDDIPDPGDGAPVGPFDVMTDVVERPASGTLIHDGDFLFLNESRLPFGETLHLRFVTRVDNGLPAGTMICNEALVTYREEESGADPPSLPRRWGNWTRDPSGMEQPSCVVIGDGPSLAESWKSVSDADGDGVAATGEELTWTITVRNTGDADATSVVVTDAVPAELVVSAVGQGGLLTGNDIEWNETTTPALASLAPGASFDLSFTASAQGCPDPGASTCNVARLSSAERPTPVGSDDPDLPGLSEPTCLPLARALLGGSPLGVVEASGDGVFDPGEAVVWTLDVTNFGDAPAEDVEAELTLPAEIDSIVPGNGGLLAGNTVSWSSAEEPALASLGPGATVSLTVDARVAVAAGGSAPCAQATLRAGPGCADEASNDAAAAGPSEPSCFTVSDAPQLELVVRATDPDANGRLSVGESLELEAELRHLGGAAATDVAVTIDLGPALALGLLEADEGGLVGVDQLAWDSSTTPALLSVGPGEVVRLHGRGTLQCSIDPAQPLCADGSATAGNLAAGITAPSRCLSVDRPDLGLGLVFVDATGDGQVEAGETVTLELQLENFGTAPALEVGVALPLDAADLDVVPMDGGSLVGPEVQWLPAGTPALAQVDPMELVTLRVELRVDPASFGQRVCHQGEANDLFDCGLVLSDDPVIGGPQQPTCWDVVGDGLPPGEVPDGDVLDAGPIPVRLSCEGEGLRLSWDAAPLATTHVVYRGALSSFGARPWTNPAAHVDDPENAEPSCGLVALTWLDEGECVPGSEDWYYLVAGRNVYGEGPLGETWQRAGSAERDPVALPCP